MVNLIVCGVEEIDQYLDKVEGVISIMNSVERRFEPLSITAIAQANPSLLLRLDFDDTWTEIHQSEEQMITSEMLEQSINFVLNLYKNGNHNSPILIHCYAGISRSSAIAISIYTALTQNAKYAVQRLSTQRPQAVPNMEVIRRADELLKMKGQLIDALWEVFYPSLLDYFNP